MCRDYRAHGEADFEVVTAGADIAFERGNKTFGAVLDLLKKETSEAKIIAALAARFDAPEAVITADVEKALKELRQIGALDE